MKTKIHIPPIKIQGIKTKLVHWIQENVVLEKNSQWIEPFMGSGVLGFNLAPQKALFADTNPHKKYLNLLYPFDFEIIKFTFSFYSTSWRKQK